MKMQNKIILPIAMLIAMTFLVSAAVTTTLNVPVTEGNYTTITFNCTTDIGSDAPPYNVSIYYNVSGDASYASGTYLGVITNTTPTSTDFTLAIDIEGLTTDGNYYNFSCYADNGTDQDSSVGIQNVTIDNTNPTLSVTRDYSSVNLHRYFEYTIVIADATSGLATQYCNITDPFSIDQGTISTSASNTVFKNTKETGYYNISCKAVDYAGNTNHASARVLVKTTGTPIVAPKGDSAIISWLDNLDRKTIIIGIVIIVLIALAVGKKK